MGYPFMVTRQLLVVRVREGCRSSPRVSNQVPVHVRYPPRKNVRMQAQMHVHMNGGKPVPDAQIERPTSGVPATQLPPVTWQKSRRSNPSGNCVELAELPGGAGVAVRNSRHPDGPALVYTNEEITAFLAGVRDGDFDHLVR